MNILLCTTELSHESQNYSGGIGSFYSEYSYGLSNKGYTVYHIGLSVSSYSGYRQDGTYIDIKKPIGYNIFMAKLLMQNNLLFLPFIFILDLYFRFVFSLSVKNCILKNKIDVIEVQDYKGIASLFKLVGIKIPIVVRVHGTNTTLSRLEVQKKNKIMCFHERLTNAIFENFIFISNAGKISYEKCFSFKVNSTIIYNGINSTIDNSKPKIKKSFQVCNFGAISNAKGLRVILEVADIFKDDKRYSFHLYGKSTPDLNKIDLLSYSNVNYHGQLPRDKLMDTISCYDTFIFPSKFENCPMAWIEAIQTKGVVLVSDIPVSSEMIQDGKTGFICDSVSDFYNKIVLLEDDKFKNKMVSESIKLTKARFSIDTMVVNSLAYYKIICS